MQMPVRKRLYLIAASVLAGAVVPVAPTLARAEAPQAPIEQEEDDAAPPQQVLSTRDDNSQDGQDGQDGDVENPTGRIARLSFTQGGVTLLSGGETMKAPATLNRPIAPGDDLSTAWDGRAEVDLGDTAVRLGSGGSFKFISLDERALRMRLDSGTANVRVRDLGENDLVEVETPQAVMSVLRPGNYRIEVTPNGATTVVKVSSGAIEARGSGGQSFIVRNQQVGTLTGATRLAFSTNTLGAPDSFDEWTLERDQRLDRAQTAQASRYVPGDVVGYEDLDSYGTWRDDPEYGYVWSPTTVVAGWSPYRYGRYSYISGWGWTWVDDAPWGFAPYHYGSWVTIGGRWCWVPGPRHGRYVGRPGNPGNNWNNRPGSPDWRHIPRQPGGSTIHNAPPVGLDSPHNGRVPPQQPTVNAPSLNNDRRMRIPRYERPGDIRPSPGNENAGRNEDRGERLRPGGRVAVPIAPPPRMENRPMPQREMSRPAAPPPPQQQQSSGQSDGGRQNAGGRNERGPNRGNSTRER